MGGRAGVCVCVISYVGNYSDEEISKLGDRTAPMTLILADLSLEDCMALWRLRHLYNDERGA